jgi:hypothetical protein
MSWYIAKIIFQIKGNGMQRPQFDEHLRLIEAESVEEALLNARIIGISSEDTVINRQHGPVSWEFVNVMELREVKEWKHGLEISSQIREIEDATHYVEYVHNRAANLQLECLAL